MTILTVQYFYCAFLSFSFSIYICRSEAKNITNIQYRHPVTVQNSTMSEDRVKEVIVDSRISKVLALRTDSITMLESLDAINEFYQSSMSEYSERF